MDALTKLAEKLDIPGFNWKGIILGITTLNYIFETYVSWRQFKVLQRKEPPVSLNKVIDRQTFEKSQKYSRAKAKFGFFSNAFKFVENYIAVTYDFLPFFWTISGQFMIFRLPHRLQGEISQSIIFVFAFQLFSSIISLPLNIYSTFFLEEKFGFNKTTPKTFVTDFIKTQLLSVAIGTPILAGFLKIIQYFGNNFFFYLWVFVFITQIALIAIYPTIIQPLFNKLTPLQDGPLKVSIENLAKRFQFPLSKLYVIDGSKRSAHSNAYFTGLPWSKHIVLFDTLIEHSSVDQVTAVLAHEIGHWAQSHIMKMLIISQIHLFIIFALFSVFINNASLYYSYGFFHEKPPIVGFLLFNDLLQPLDTILTFIMNLLSRKFEFEADNFAEKAGFASDLSEALIKLQIENLSAMDVDWIYSAYNYSHPILSERLAALNFEGHKKE